MSGYNTENIPPLRWRCRERRGLSTHCPIRCYETAEKDRATKFSYGSYEGTSEAGREAYDDALQRFCAAAIQAHKEIMELGIGVDK